MHVVIQRRVGWARCYLGPKGLTRLVLACLGLLSKFRHGRASAANVSEKWNALTLLLPSHVVRQRTAFVLLCALLVCRFPKLPAVNTLSTRIGPPRGPLSLPVRYPYCGPGQIGFKPLLRTTTILALHLWPK
jgi:hypothetical protein